MPRKPTISPEIKAEVQKLIDEFNRQHFKKADSMIRAFFGNKVKPGYSARFKGKYLYLDRNDHIKPSPICRLTWNGKMDDWGFAIYKYSGNQYDSEEWFFPGAGEVDGTVIGAMKAGMKAYEN
ncbi:MAG: hypothetical protein M3R47_12180 [Chloroflexota bacterium]|nr:hypothetical protein [Chloroflexota bacterium]